MQIINRRSVMFSSLGLGGLLATPVSQTLAKIVVPDKELILKDQYLDAKHYFENWFKHTIMNDYGIKDVDPWDFKEINGPIRNKKEKTGLAVYWNGDELYSKYGIDTKYGYHWKDGEEWYMRNIIGTKWFSQQNLSIEEYQQIENMFNHVGIR